MRLLAAVFSAATLLAGCSLFTPDEGDVRITTDREVYARGETAQIEVQNRTEQTLTYQHCPGWRLQFRTNTDDWEDDPGTSTCPIAPIVDRIAPGQTLQLTLPVASQAMAGEPQLARFRLYIGKLGQDGKYVPLNEETVSNPFTIGVPGVTR